MEWSEEEERTCHAAAKAKGMYLPSDVLRAVMTRAVGLAAARGGTMTARDAKELRTGLIDGTEIPHVRECLAAALDDLSAFGARVAVLEGINNAAGADVVRRREQVSDLEKSLENALKERDAARDAVGVARSVAHSRADERDAEEAALAELKQSGELADPELWCDVCRGLRPHRWRPSPEAGPFWRCSECGAAFMPNSDPADTAAAVHMLAKLAAKTQARAASLKPSGQVAEDVARLTESLSSEMGLRLLPGDRDAISRLAAKAQGYEAAVADNAELLGLIREDTTCGKGGSCIECGWIGHHHADCKRGMAACGRGHPGAALLEEHRKALVRARNEGLEKVAIRFDERAARLRTEASAAVPLRAREMRMQAAVASDDADFIRAMKEPEQ